MHTEEQAQALWCPMVRHEGNDAGSFNRGVFARDPINCEDEEGLAGRYVCNCIASKCAMWRWGDGIWWVDNGAPIVKTGYCGLAGRPGGAQ